MTIATAKNTPRNTYTATGGQTVFTIGFEFFNTTDIRVFRNGTELSYNASPSTVSQFSVQGISNASDSSYEFGAGGTITLGSGATVNDSIVIVRDIIVERTTDFIPAASFDVTALNTQLDTLMAMMAEREESTSRSIRLPLSETTTVFDMELPVLADRQNKILEFDANGDPACTITAANLSTLGTITSDITTVAGISANVTTVAGISSNVTTVAGIASDVTSVAAKASFITADFIADLNTLAVTDIINDINLLATSDIVADLNTLATSDIVSDLNTLATSDIVSDLNTLATSDIVTDLNILATTDNVTNMATLGAAGVVTNIGTVAGISANVTTVAGVSSDVTTVAGVSANVTTVAGVSANVTTVAGISSDVTSVAGISSNVTSVAGITSDVTTVAGVASNVTTVATNIAGVNSFAERYRVGSSDPASSLDEGDLFYNSTDNAVKYYNGSAWQSITAGIANVVEDVTPQLGGNLDLNSSDITGTGNINITGTIDASSTVTAPGFVGDLRGAIEFDGKADVDIDKGEVVYISGLSGNTPTVALARANSSSTIPAAGIAAENITATSTGKIVSFGNLSGLDVANFGETSITFAEGDTVYVSSAEAGKLTNVAPSGESNFIQNIGRVTRITPTTNATIIVGGAGRTNASPALNNGNIFIGNASNVATTASLTTSITTAGALMDSECTSLADVKALNQSVTSTASPTFVTLNATTVDLGNWTITESAGVLYFATSGTNKMKLDASGNLTVVGDITAYGTV